MNVMRIRNWIAPLLLSSAVAACSGGGGGTNAIPNVSALHAERGRSAASSNLLARIVGVGDSLTAGYQSQGFLGELGVRNPLGGGLTLPPTQEAGWWADMDEEAATTAGLTLDQAVQRMYDPAIS